MSKYEKPELRIVVYRRTCHILMEVSGKLGVVSGRDLWGRVMRARSEYSLPFVILDLQKLTSIESRALKWLRKSMDHCARAGGICLLARPFGEPELLLHGAGVPYSIRLPGPNWPRSKSILYEGNDNG